MKRLLISVLLLGMVGGLCVFSLHTQQQGCRDLLMQLNQIETLYTAGELGRCQQLADRFPAAFEETAKPFSLFLHHSYLAAIKEVAVTLPVILREKEYAHFLTELAHCRSLLEQLEELERPTLENIL